MTRHLAVRLRLNPAPFLPLLLVISVASIMRTAAAAAALRRSFHPRYVRRRRPRCSGFYPPYALQ